MDFGFLKDVFSSDVAIFLYGAVLGFALGFKVNMRLLAKHQDFDTSPASVCLFVGDRSLRGKSVYFKVHNINNTQKLFCKNLAPKKRFLVFKTYHCKTLNAPCPYCTWY